MKLGRNDPCHCGSGKKYKKCCLEKDEAAALARQEQTLEYDEDFDDDGETEDDMTFQPDDSSSPPMPVPKDENQMDLELFDDDDYEDDDDEDDEEDDDDLAPEIDEQSAKQRWKEFEKQNYEGKIALFIKTLDEPKLMDDEMAFGMLDTLRQETSTHNERHRYDALVEQLRERLPKVYAKSAHFYLENCIENAVITGRFERIHAFMNELAARAGRDIDTFNNVVNQLAYHNRLSTLIDAMHIGWPLVNHSGEIVPWGVDEFADQAVKFLVFDYVEQHPAAIAGDAELFERIRFYSQVDAERINKFIAILSGHPSRQWTRDAFTFKPIKRQPRDRYGDDKGIKIPKPVQQNLFDFSLEFQSYLYREQKVPLTKSELGREQIVNYVIERLAGKLEPRLSMIEAAFNKPKPKTRPPEFYMSGDENSVNWLCPDRETFDHFLSGLFHFLNDQPYKAAVTFEIMPFWLRFLETRQLLSAPLHEKTLHELR
ncbi:MAG: YecA family protein, partial [bacterium]